MQRCGRAPLAQLAEQLTLNGPLSESPRDSAQKTRENVTIKQVVTHINASAVRAKVKHL